MTKTANIDETLKADIKEHFWNQYYDSTKASKPGLLGKFMRAPEFLRKPVLGSAVLAGLAASTLVLSATIVPLLLAMVAAGAYIGVSAAADFSLISATEKTIDRDIVNGKLGARYQTVLDEKSKAISAQKSQLSDRTARPDFAAATAAPAAMPVRRHRFSPLRQLRQ